MGDTKMWKIFKKKKGQQAANIMMVFGGLAVGLLIFGVVIVLFNVFISKASSINAIQPTGDPNLTNASIALRSVQTIGNTLIDWVDIGILIGVFAVLLGGLIFGGIWAYNKWGRG